jgi:TRAP-type C4-dicarboxylate transport system substrate-binding protein
LAFSRSGRASVRPNGHPIDGNRNFAQQKQVFERFSKEMRKAVRKLGKRNQEEERRAREKAERRAQRPCGQG